MTTHRFRIALLYGAAISGFLLPLAITWHAIREQTRQHLLAQAEDLATSVLRSAEMVSDQSVSAIQSIEQHRIDTPCDDQSVTLMRQELIRNKLLQDVGYIKDNWLRCSALLASPHDLGPFDYHSAIGNQVRVHLWHPLVPTIRTMALTHAESGYTVFVHPDLLLDMLPKGEASQIALVNISNQKVVMTRGPMAADAHLGQVTRAQAFVELKDERVRVWKPSSRYDFGALVTVPAEVLASELHRQFVWMVFMALGASGVLAWVLFRIARITQSLPTEFKQALKRHDELFLVYQPIVDTRSGDWVGVEALLRWRRQNGEHVAPDLFIAMAERRGLIKLVTEKVMFLLSQDMPRMLAVHPRLQMAINVCAEDLKCPGIVDRFQALIAQLGVPATQIHVEITERVAVDIDQSIDNVRRLHALGIKVSLDDFGTGYSSLTYLATLEPDQVKIDRSFVAAIGKGLVTSHVVDHVIELGHRMHLDMVAEGVETQQQADYLRARGVQWAQGWHYAKPMPVSAWLEQYRRPNTAAPLTPVPA
ncbi:EAL domain-containing protein [Curvibacter gracilis]|uniref:EAL domain-containing protein n=1 Tax=Curvibacter gracilis TaxID=230310 RepID=UPI00048A1786|nr:EAL domain-containing protein [Curvibacter gracilis]